MDINMGKMTVYHGSYTAIEKPKIIQGRNTKDFGIGFYCTMISRERNLDIVDALFAAYNSYVSEKIDDYNSSFYYDAPQNILNSFLYGKIK